VGFRASRVLLLTDINARVPVLIERTRDQAVLSGDNSPMPELRYLPRDVDIKIGDRIVTSGAGGAFPPGLPVGEVADVSNGHYRVQPLADLARLEYLRLVNYALPGILADDLGIDTTGFDPTRQGTIDSLLTGGASNASATVKAPKKKSAIIAAPPAAPTENQLPHQRAAGSE
jgi:rod shape-determining protein MreC